MRKLISYIFILANLSATLSVYAGSVPGTGVFNSIHDLTNGPDGKGIPLSVPGFVTDSQKRLCAYCHTPHHAIFVGSAGNNGADTLPLWSHQVTNLNFTPYASSTFTPRGGQSMSPDPLTGSSRLCMSCHDGVTAVDNYVDNFSLTKNNHAMIPLASPPYPGMPIISNFGNKSHPIGFAMTDVIPGYPGSTHPDPSNIQPLIDSSRFIINTNRDYGGPTIISRLSQGAIMTCSTCHDVHNSLNKGVDIANPQNYLIYGTQSNSGICLSCHTVASGVSGPAHNWP